MGIPAPTTKDDAQALFRSLRSSYSTTPTNLKLKDLYVVFAISTALIQITKLQYVYFGVNETGSVCNSVSMVGYMAIVGSFPFNSFLSGVLSCVGTAVLPNKLQDDA